MFTFEGTEMNLEQEALRYFFSIFNTIQDKPAWVGDGHYSLLFRNNGDILFHPGSIITFCHITKPEVFYELTQSSFRQAFPSHRRIWCDKINLSYRYVPEEEFWRLMK